MDLCDDLIKRLHDRSLIPEQSSYEDIKMSAHCLLQIYVPLTRNDRNLSHVEKQLAEWSGYNYLKSLSKFRSL